MQSAGYILILYSHTYIHILSMFCHYGTVSTFNDGEQALKTLWAVQIYVQVHWRCDYEGVLICPILFSSPSSVSMFCDFSSSSSYRRLEMSCLISFSSPEEKQAQRHKRKALGALFPKRTQQQVQFLASFCWFYLQWSRHSLGLLGPLWCNALSVASWSSATRDGNINNTVMGKG